MPKPNVPELRRTQVREAVGQALEESAYYSARGVRPPAQRVDAPKVGPIVARLSDAARNELLTFDDPSGCLDQGVPERMLLHAAGCVRRTVAQIPTVRQITSPQGLARDAGLGTIQWNDGGTARVIPQIPLRLAVLDRTVALVPLDMNVFYNGMLVVRDPVVVNALVNVHEHWWATGADPTADHDPHELPTHLAPVLAALSEGLTDQAAAARLNLSPRTYTRRVGELLALLGTTSRFQAGKLAAQRGWS
ncbi:helix-turn-helix domain-containing protein [Actinomadura sp. KC216]|uniref:response regulator transcription factor n=1 Tax=Actinomadura sp. KC216 TaxID=2530370 RepID=UPI0010496A00|nr:response regulator transcription factor [Actinomadura sp. KC216]TDB90638.1 helix-turn-helix domain-containing protein [Actinomadura sp. KC216]